MIDANPFDQPTPTPDQTADTGPIAAVSEPATFEDLTLAQMFSELRRAPGPTLRALAAVARASDAPASDLAQVGPPSLEAVYALVPATHAITIARPVVPARRSLGLSGVDILQFALRLVALFVAWYGCAFLASPLERTSPTGLADGAPYLLAGALIWLVSEVIPIFVRSRFASTAAVNESLGYPMASAHVSIVWRAILVLAAAGFTYYAWILNVDNHFTPFGFVAWMMSIILWASALAPAGWSYWRALRQQITRLRATRWRFTWTLGALILIMALGAFFRLRDLQNVPPEMTSDHVEKLLDSYRVAQGDTNIFMANNGGREPAQFYILAILGSIPGLGFTHLTLKLLTAVEGLITLPALWWMGREIIGPRDRKLGNLVGLALAALVAASYWHTSLSRLGLRIVLTTLVVAVAMVYLARAMRYNRRADFLLCGLVLGFGVYTYQAVRMLPVVVFLGVLLAFIFHWRTWRERGRGALNFLALVLVAFVVFIPLFHYTVQYPEDFWRRTTGRLMGDDVIQTTDASGNIVQRNATIQDRVDAFRQNLPVLVSNIDNALLMFNWKGDVEWINGAPNYPTFDPISGALLIVGLAAFAGYVVKRRGDVVLILMPLMVLIMLLPTALSIAYPAENPSFTRASGAIPPVYFIAALPLALLALSAARALSGRRFGQIVAFGLATVLVLGSYAGNASVYFGPFVQSYLVSSLPYSEAGRVLQGFADSDGSYGNAFMIAYPYWWDHRAVGIDAGAIDWPNGILSIKDVPQFLADAAQRTDKYRLDPDKDLLFFYAPKDDETQAQLRQWFPNGYGQDRQSYQPEDTYRLYRVPRLGQDGFNQFIDATLHPEGYSRSPKGPGRGYSL